MPFVSRHRVVMPVSTSAGATQSFFTDGLISGLLEAITLTRATASALSTAAGLTITGEKSGLTLLVATATGSGRTWYPRAGVENVSGQALGYTSAATPPAIPDRMPIGQERIRVQVASGGVASGRFTTGNYLDLYVSGA